MEDHSDHSLIWQSIESHGLEVWKQKLNFNDFHFSSPSTQSCFTLCEATFYCNDLCFKNSRPHFAGVRLMDHSLRTKNGSSKQRFINHNFTIQVGTFFMLGFWCSNLKLPRFPFIQHVTSSRFVSHSLHLRESIVHRFGQLLPPLKLLLIPNTSGFGVSNDFRRGTVGHEHACNKVELN